jgi:hypothetical protein
VTCFGGEGYHNTFLEFCKCGENLLTDVVTSRLAGQTLDHGRSWFENQYLEGRQVDNFFRAI